MSEPSGQWQDEPGPSLFRDDLFITQLNNFLDAIEKGSPLLCTLAEGVQTLRVNLAILKSIDQTSWTTI